MKVPACGKRRRKIQDFPLHDQSIQIIGDKISAQALRSLCNAWFGDMVKLVVDIERKRIAVGGDLHADGEEMLLQEGSMQEDLWGVNFYPRQYPGKRIEFTALINIRPHQNNPGIELLDSEIRDKIKRIVEENILRANEELV